MTDSTPSLWGKLKRYMVLETLEIEFGIVISSTVLSVEHSETLGLGNFPLLTTF